MKRLLQSSLILLAVLTGVFPAGSCVKMAMNPNSDCCAIETAHVPETSGCKHACCKKDHGANSCQPLSPSSEKLPCCAYMPGHLACAESIPLLIPAFSHALPVSHDYIGILLSLDANISTFTSAPPDDPSPCPLFISHHCILV